MDSYVFQDRGDANKWKLTIEDGQPVYTLTSDTASSDPIVADHETASTWWKLYIEDGEFAWETTATEQDDSFVFIDTTTSLGYKFAIIANEAALISRATAAITKITKFIIVRYNNVRKIIRYVASRNLVRYTNTEKIAI